MELKRYIRTLNTVQDLQELLDKGFELKENKNQEIIVTAKVPFLIEMKVLKSSDDIHDLLDNYLLFTNFDDKFYDCTSIGEYKGGKSYMKHYGVSMELKKNQKIFGAIWIMDPFGFPTLNSVCQIHEDGTLKFK